MNKLIKKLTTWMLVFGMTFTPVLTSIDLVAVNAEDENGQTTITVDQAQENVSGYQEQANKETPTEPEGTKPNAENTGAQQLIENAQKDVAGVPAATDPKVDTTGLSNDLGKAAEAIGNAAENGEEATGAQKNFADAAASLDEAKKQDDSTSELLKKFYDEDGNRVDPIIDENGNPTFDE